VILLGEGISRLRRYPATYAEIDVDELLASSAALLTALQQLGQDQIMGNNAIASSLRLPNIVRVTH